MVAQGRGHIKSSPSKKEGLSKKKARAEKGHIKKSALEEKKGAKNKKNTRGTPFFLTQKKCALDSYMPNH